MTRYTPLEDRVLVIPIKEKVDVSEDGLQTKGTTEGGILIAATIKRETQEAEVYSVGLGRYANETGVFMSTVLAKGDIVLIGVNGGMPVEVPMEDGKKVEMKLMREGDVLALIKKKEISS